MTTGTHNSTIVGVFKDYSSAEQAARELVNTGLPADSVHVKSSTRTAAAGRSDYQTKDEGGISGFFHRIFGGEDDATARYSNAVEGGRSVVVVHAMETQIDQAVAVMNQYGAIDVNEDADEDDIDDEDHVASDYSRGTVRPSGNAQALAAGKTIPVVDEELNVGKRSVQRGGVRVYSKVVDHPVEQNITLRDEKVRVDRRPADRILSKGELAGLRDQTYEVAETVEEPVIEKHARVKEEVVIGKESFDRTQTVRDTVRRTDVTVEKMGAAESAAGQGYEKDFRSDWERNYASQGGDYSTYAPFYNYGSRCASDSRFKGRSWSDAENDVRAAYERDNPGSTWDRAKNAVKYGWDKVTGQ